MKTFKPLHRLAVLSVVGLAWGLPASAQAEADFAPCVGTGYDIRTLVSVATDCTLLLPLDGNQNDTPLPDFVNDAGFFGLTDWLFDGKWNSTDSGFVDSSDLYRFDVDGDGVSGAFTYVGGTDIADIMFVFKDGAGTNLVGYRLLPGDGTYQTPFTSPPFPLTGRATQKDTSHISVYYREGGTPPAQIPAPGTLLLVGAGLAGLGWMRRRKAG